MSNLSLDQLDTANACHDDDPARAAELLRSVDPAELPPERWPGLAFLLNHVFGEKLGLPAEAHAMFGPLLSAAGSHPPLALWRQAAAAAQLAGDSAAARRLSDSLATAASASAPTTQHVVALTAAMYRAPAADAAEVADAVLPALQAVQASAWEAPHPLDSAVAACANNIAASLQERSQSDLAQGALRAALDLAAQTAERFWLRAGTWVHYERAAYGRAAAATALGEPHRARHHALRALALLDEHDLEKAENVDRAFIELELAHACRHLGLAEEARKAQANADTLAANFNDAGLDAWFAKRGADLAAMTRR